MSDLIEAVSRQVRTMSDGTLRLTVDIPPTSAQDAFKLFGAPDVPMVLARLTQEAAMQSAMKETIEGAFSGTCHSKITAEELSKPKGGELAKLAGIFCQEPKFWAWANSLPGLKENNFTIDNETDAAIWIRGMCDVASRSELDGDEDAACIFHTYIRTPYSSWLRTNG